MTDEFIHSMSHPNKEFVLYCIVLYCIVWYCILGLEFQENIMPRV